MSLQRYPAYKDSGIPWLGEIPAHWKVKKLSRSFQTIGSGTTPPSGEEKWYEGYMPWVTTSELREKIILDTAKKVSQETLIKFPTLKVYSPGTVLLAMYGATIGRLGILGVHACTNQACCALADPVFIDNKFAYYWLWGNKDKIINLSSGGGQPNINQDKVRELRMPVPYLPEQRVIAAFLDERTEKLDKLIANKHEQIKQLETLRKVTIHDAVTKGLNSDAPMKDSGIPWLGKIPAHWQVKRLKKVITFQRGHDLPDQDRQEGTIPVVSSGGVSGRHNEFKAKGPGIVTGRYGTIGQFQYIEEDYWPLNTALYGVRMWSNSDRYLWYLLHNISALFLMLSGKSAVPGIDRNDIHEIHVALPLFPDQQSIAAYLDERTEKLDKLVANKREQIKQLETLRKVTIHDAVTGKVKVTGVEV